MGDQKAGDLTAIRDWSRRYFYTKSEVSEFFTKLNTNLTAYKFNLIGPKNKTVTLADNATVNPQTYTIQLNPYGLYTGLFFFNEGETLTITVTDGETISYNLGPYTDTIYLNELTIATPIMTSNTAPSGKITVSHSWNGAPWRAFNRNESTSDYWEAGSSSPRWLCYEFPEQKIIYRIKMMIYVPGDPQPSTDTFGKPQDFDWQASNDGENWDVIYTQNVTLDRDVRWLDLTIENPTYYKYYKYVERTRTIGTWTAIYEIYLYTIEE